MCSYRRIALIKMSERQLELFARQAFVSSIDEALSRHPDHKASLADLGEFRRFCLEIARAYKLNDANHVAALVALCLDLGPARRAFFALPEIAALPHADRMEGHQRLHLAGSAAQQQGFIGDSASSGRQLP